MNDRGMALLMTLLVVALLSVAAVSMHGRGLLAQARARNSVNALTATYIMRSGISVAMGYLERDARESAIDTLSETWAQEIKEFPVGEGTVSIRITDEASMFNINTLVTPQGKINDRAVERFGRLLRLVGMEERLAERVAEWLRSRREHLSYTLRDTSELLLVTGLPSEAVKGIEGYVTVYTDRLSDRTININTVGREVLAALSPKLSDALVEGILEYRRENPFSEIGQLKRVQGMNDEILYTFSDVIDVKSSTFAVHAEAKVSDVVRRGSAFVSRASVGRDGVAVRIVAWKEE